MKTSLRYVLTLVAIFVCAGAWAQKPVSGVYKISNLGTGNYVKVYRKYYAKPDVTTDNATGITVGIGAKDLDGSYKVYSLEGAYNGGTTQLFDHVEKALKLIKELGEEKLNKRLEDLENMSSSIEIDEDQKADIIKTALEAADMYYTDYGYLSLEPVSVNGTTVTARLKLTIPAVPIGIDYVSKAMTSGHKDAWTWAKQYILNYVEKNHGKTSDLYQLSHEYIDDLEPGTTYYLTAHAEDNGTFDFCDASKIESLGENGVWKMELVSEDADGLETGKYQIQNVATEMVVNVTDKYKAEPDLTVDEANSTLENLANTTLEIEFGRISRNDANLYQITMLKNGNQDVCEYIQKGIKRSKEFAQKKLDNNQSKAQEYIDKANRKVKEKFFAGEEDQFTEYTFANLKSDVDYAADLYAEAFGNMKLVDNGDGTVSTYVTLPRIPELLDDVMEVIKGEEITCWEWLKEQMVEYFADGHSENISSDFVERNLNKIEPNKTYYLAADNANTFDYVEDIQDVSKWKFVEPNAEIDEYVRIKNAHERANGEQYVYVTDAFEAQPNATADDAKTLPGTIIRLGIKTVDGEPVLTTLRSQGVDVIGTDSGNGYVEFLKNKMGDKLLKPFVKELFGTENPYNDLNEQVFSKWDLNVHIESAGCDAEGTPRYYVYATTPSFEGIVSYYQANKETLDANMSDTQKAAMAAGSATLYKEFVSAVYKTIEEYAPEMAEGHFGQLVKKYIDAGRINQNKKIYLMSGENPGNSTTYTEGEAKFDFCNATTELETVGDAAMWYVEAVDTADNYFGVKLSGNVKDSTHYYTSAHFDFAMQLPEGMAAYYGKTMAKDDQDIYVFTLSEIEGDVIPAGVPVILQCSATDAESNKILPVASDATFSEANLLESNTWDDKWTKEASETVSSIVMKAQGSNAKFFNSTLLEDYTNNGHIHVLSKTQSGKPGILFYTGDTLNGNKIFVRLETPIFNTAEDAKNNKYADSNAKGLRLVFEKNDGTTTGITVVETTETVEGNGQIYDLSGRAVKNPSKGIYIMNGKKVVLK